MITIRPATGDELEAVGRVLARAFVDDPLWTWIAPPGGWESGVARWFEAEARNRASQGAEVLVDDDLRGAAIWAGPGRWTESLGYTVRMVLPHLGAFRGRLLRAARVGDGIAKVHPREPHWYLGYLGTDPDHQGAGVGGALITAVTERCDDLGLPAYLESSKETNLGFYARHGFEARDPLTPGGSPRVWPMWREPRT